MSITNEGVYNLSTESNETRKEIDIRGRLMMFACDIEYCLLNIISFCSPDPYNHERAGQFHSMRMKNKIDNAICDIKRHNLSYYYEFEQAFNDLDRFREVRNDMAHFKGDFQNGDLSKFKVLFVDKDLATGIEGIKARIYPEEIIISLYNLFAVTNSRLSSLWMRLKQEFDEKHPLAFPSPPHNVPPNNLL